MNVDEAMAFDPNCVCGGTKEKPQVDDCERCRFVVEVERLRAELAAAGDGDTWREACGRVEAELEKVRAELAAAKAASVVPVEIQSVYVNKYLGSVVVFIGNEKGAVEFDAWLRERMKDAPPPAT